MPQSKSPVLEPRTQAFIDALAAQGGEPLYKLSYGAARQLLEDLQARPVAESRADVEEKVLSVVPLEKFLCASVVRRNREARFRL